MKRDDRMFDLIQLMRDGRLHTAAELAAQLGVSVRTIWRDMSELATTGLPIEGERGLGYILRSPLVLPPMMMTTEELEALSEGLQQIALDEKHPRSRAARSLLNKVQVLLPQAAVAGS